MSENTEHIGIDGKSTVERDRIDFNAELSGANTNRISRFLSDNDSDTYSKNNKKKPDRQFQSMLAMLLAEDEQYRRLYIAVQDNLKTAYQATEQAFTELEKHLSANDHKLQFLRDSAAELEDGTKVFLSSDGNIYTEDGQRLNNEDAENINIPDGAPSWEVYKVEQELRASLLRDRLRIEDYTRNTLDDVDKRLSDPDDPLTKDELEDLKDGFPDMPTLENNLIALPASKAIDYSTLADTLDEQANVPGQSLSTDFNNAHDCTLDLSELEVIAPQQTLAPAPKV